MAVRTEFPYIEARRADLEHQHYEASKQADDAARGGKPDGAAQEWLKNIRAELGEVNYVLDYFQMIRYRNDQGWRAWQTIAMIAVVLLSLALSIFSIVRG